MLLLRTLEQTDRIAIVNFALRQKTRLAALRVRDDVLVIQTLLWPDEVRAAEFPSLDESGHDQAGRAEDGLDAGGQLRRRLPSGGLHRRLPGRAAAADRRETRRRARPSRPRRWRRRARTPRWSTCWPRCSAVWSGTRAPTRSPATASPAAPVHEFQVEQLESRHQVRVHARDRRQQGRAGQAHPEACGAEEDRLTPGRLFEGALGGVLHDVGQQPAAGEFGALQVGAGAGPTAAGRRPPGRSPGRRWPAAPSARVRPARRPSPRPGTSSRER